MIRSAKISEIPEIMLITKACAEHMIAEGIYQWNAHYPNREVFELDIKRDELYVLTLQGILSGTIVISTIMDAEYMPVKWLTPNGNSIYIHRLSVHPNLQGRGHARKLMDFAETFARDNGFVSVRLDTFSQNKRNQRFYEARGYQKLTDIHFPKQSTHPFHCYELVL